MFNRFNFSKYFIDIQWVLFSIVSSSFAHFILRIAIGSYLGADDLGLYTLSFTVYMLGMQFAAFGIGAALTKLVSQFIEEENKTISYIISGTAFSFISGLIIGGIFFVSAPIVANNFFDMPQLTILIRITSFTFPFIALQKSILGTLNGIREMKKFAFINVFQNITVLIFTLIVVLILDFGVKGAVFGYVIPTILISIFSPLLIKQYFSNNLLKIFKIKYAKETLTFGFFVVLANSIGYLNGQIDSILIGYYLDSTEVGIYSVAFLFGQIMYLIPSSIQRIMTPIISNLHGKGQIKKVRYVVFKTMKRSFLIASIISLTLAIIGQFLITILFGTEFNSAYEPLLILLVGFTISAAFVSVSSTLSSIGKVKMIFRITILTMSINIILNIILIPNFGIEGAALATTLAKISSFSINLFLLNYFLK